MPRCAALLLALMVCGCGAPEGPRWKTTLTSPDGRPVNLMMTARVIRFSLGEPPRDISRVLDLGMQGARLDLPALTDGYYELWQACLRPLRSAFRRRRTGPWARLARPAGRPVLDDDQHHHPHRGHALRNVAW